MNPVVGDLKGNANKIIASFETSRSRQADLILFPELCLCGYPPEDLLLLPAFIEAAERELERIVAASQGVTAIVGVPRRNDSFLEKPLYNSAAIIQEGKLIGFQDKSLLPTYDVFDERRYFEPATSVKHWMIKNKRVGIVICEDMWPLSELTSETLYRRNPIEELKEESLDLLLNLSASPFSVNKFPHRYRVCSQSARALQCPTILCNQVGGNDSLIFDGHSLVFSSAGELMACGLKFEEDLLCVDLKDPLQQISVKKETEEDLFGALVLGVRDYFQKSGFSRACLGLSGGIDSALTACIAASALGAENVLGVSMPSRFSSEGSLTDARALAKNLGVFHREISIESPFQAYLDLLHPFFAGKEEDVTDENLQARIRGMILMALSNKFGYIVLSSGNKSELAMGYSTLYGDLCGGLAVIADLTKSQAYQLARWINREEEIIPWSSIEKPPSAELRFNQKDQDALPPYETIDQVVLAYLEEKKSPEEIIERYGYEKEIVFDLIGRIHRNEYKRRQSPPGLRISEKSFSTGRRFPIVERWMG